MPSQRLVSYAPLIWSRTLGGHGSQCALKYALSAAFGSGAGAATGVDGGDGAFGGAEGAGAAGIVVVPGFNSP